MYIDSVYTSFEVHGLYEGKQPHHPDYWAVWMRDLTEEQAREYIKMGNSLCSELAIMEVNKRVVHVTKNKPKKETPAKIEIKFKKFLESKLDNYYNDEKYDGKIKIMTKDGDVHSLYLRWEQGRGNNYRFMADQFDTNCLTIYPDDVEFIEDLS